MGRTPTKNKNLPKGMRARVRPSGVHYYLDSGERPRREFPLGKDYILAVQQWAVRTKEKSPKGTITFRQVAENYQREVLPTKAPATQEINLRELSHLYEFFDVPPVQLEAIEAKHIRQYLDWRWKSTLQAKRDKNAEREKAGKATFKITGKEGQVPANREKALFSHIWNYARDKGLTNMANPCAGIKGFKEAGRDAYIIDQVFSAVWEAGDEPLRDAMDVAYLTGQRPADVRKISQADAKDGELSVLQNKTGTKLRVSIEGQLAVVMERIKGRKVVGKNLLSNSKGQALTEYELRGAFDRARVKAAEAHPELADEIRGFQFRDLRAKAGTDTEEVSGMEAAQSQLGHTTSAMTAHYVRHRRGKLVKPTK